jgi:hypothetical protein
MDKEIPSGALVRRHCGGNRAADLNDVNSPYESCHGNLPQHRMCYPKDRRVLNASLGQQQFLHHTGAELASTDVNEVCFPAQKEQPAIIVQVADIPYIYPMAGPPELALVHVISLRVCKQHVTGFARLAEIAEVVLNSYVAARQRPADRAGPIKPFLWERDCSDAFGCAVEFGNYRS